MSTTTPRDVTAPLVLTIDIGSSSTRALLFDAQGREVEGCIVQMTNELHTTRDGGVEDDPREALKRIEDCIDGVLEAAGSLADRIEAVATSTYVSNLMGLDAANKPITPIYLYADTRNTEDANALREQFDEATVLERTGCLLRTSYLPARLRWLRRTQPDTVEQVRRWVSLGELMLLRFCGEGPVSYSVASWSGLLNRRTLNWDNELLDALDLDEATLSPLADIDQPVRTLQSEYAERWPALVDVAWFPAVGDGAVANIGSGCIDPSNVALTIGTSGALRVVAPQIEEIPWGLWCYRVDSNRALLGGATSEGGNIFAWLSRTLQLPAAEKLEQVLGTSQPDEHGMTVLPFLVGERSPGWAGNVRASFVGISLETTADDILQAALESVTYRFALIARLLLPAVEGNPAIIAGGGALVKSPAWTQMCADVLGQTIYLSSVSEPSSRGAALLALEALGVVDDLSAMQPEHQRAFEPNPAYVPRYAAAIERQQDLYRRLIDSE